MKIEILGTRGLVEPSAPEHTRHTGFLIDDTLLVDAGEKDYMERHPQALVFTHFHPDHAWFVGSNEEFNPGIPVYGPEEHELIQNLKVIEGEFQIKGYRFTQVPVIHSLKMKSLGYLIQKGQKRIFISGDVAWIEKQHHDKIKGCDLVITEASFIRKGGIIRRKNDQIYGHTGIPDLVRMFSPLTSKIVFTHYGSWFLKDTARGKQKIKNLETEEAKLLPGHDGMLLEV